MVQDYGPQNAYLNGARCRKNTQVQEGGSVEKGWKVGENTSVETFLVKTKALKQQTFPSNRKKNMKFHPCMIGFHWDGTHTQGEIQSESLPGLPNRIHHPSKSTAVGKGSRSTNLILTHTLGYTIIAIAYVSFTATWNWVLGNESQWGTKLKEDICTRWNLSFGVSAALSISVSNVSVGFVSFVFQIWKHWRVCSIGDNLPHSWPTHCHVIHIYIYILYIYYIMKIYQDLYE